MPVNAADDNGYEASLPCSERPEFYLSGTSCRKFHTCKSEKDIEKV